MFDFGTGHNLHSSYYHILSNRLKDSNKMATVCKFQRKSLEMWSCSATMQWYSVTRNALIGSEQVGHVIPLLLL